VSDIFAKKVESDLKVKIRILKEWMLYSVSWIASITLK